MPSKSSAHSQTEDPLPYLRASQRSLPQATRAGELGCTAWEETTLKGKVCLVIRNDRLGKGFNSESTMPCQEDIQLERQIVFPLGIHPSGWSGCRYQVFVEPPVTLNGSEMVIKALEFCRWMGRREPFHTLSAPHTQNGRNSFKWDRLGGVYRVDPPPALQVGCPCGPCSCVPLLFLGNTGSLQSKPLRSHPPFKTGVWSLIIPLLKMKKMSWHDWWIIPPPSCFPWLPQFELCLCLSGKDRVDCRRTQQIKGIKNHIVS